MSAELIFIEYRRCCRCKEEKELGDFAKNQTRCRVCDIEAGKIYRSTLKGFLQGLIIGSKVRSKRIKTVTKKSTSEHSISKQDLIDLYTTQKRKCYYSDIEMKYNHHTDWMMSIERLNDNLGYTKENTVLCCHEFNSGKNQWTLKKIECIRSLIKKEINLGDLKSLIDLSLSRRSQKDVLKKTYVEELSVDSEEKRCHLCEEFYSFTDFIKNPYLGCKSCRRKQKDSYYSSLRGFVISLVGAARSRTTKRNKKGRSLDFDITPKDIFDLILTQKGRCFYSSIPLVFSIKSDWMCSIERIDNDVGYTKENIVLICNEFNTSSLTCLASDESEITGSGQWSVSKFNYFLQSIKGKNEL